MRRNSLLLQALAVTMMGVVAQLSSPAPASAAPTSACGWSNCTGMCGVGNPCGGECPWVCFPPPTDMCGLVMWYEACLFPE
jgi:hypothetical protein